MRYDAVRTRFDDPVEYFDVNLSLNYHGDLKKSVQSVSISLLPKSMCLMRVLQHCIVLNDEEYFITQQIFGRSKSRAQFLFYQLSDQSVF